MSLKFDNKNKGNNNSENTQKQNEWNWTNLEDVHIYSSSKHY